MQTQARRPLQIYLQPRQDRALRLLAQREGVSLAEVVRRSLDHYIESEFPPEKDPSLQLIGLGRGSRSDLSENHDRVVAEQARGTRP